MADIKAFNIDSLNLKVSPFLQGNGQVLRALNVKRDTLGGYKKREGYTTFLGTADGETVNTLFSWQQNAGNTNVYRASGSVLYYSTAGTGDWTPMTNGTITDGTQIFHGVTANTLMVSQSGGTTRHSTDGVELVDTSDAPTEALGFEEYEGRMWAIGTASDAFYSTTGTPTDWTTDSSSLNIPGAGKLKTIFKAGDRLVFGKSSGLMHRYDGYNLRDLATNLAPTSPFAIGIIEGYRVYPNRMGYFGYGGAVPEIISNTIERQIYNDAGSGVQGTSFDNMPGIAYKYDYFACTGTITDDLTGVTIEDNIHKYDFQMDEWVNWKFADRPTSFGTFEDESGNEQLIFGASSGQSYQLSGTATSDNGSPIEVQIMGFLHGGSFDEKEWKWILGMFNPGCKAKIQIALSDTFSPRTLNWQDVGGADDGVVEYRFPSGARARFCFWKIYESGSTAPFQFYGWQFKADLVGV